MVELGAAIRDKYEVIEKLREGGMGAVYKVHHRLLDELRVVKVMKPGTVANEEMRQRFLAEAKTASRLKHPNIAHIYDFAIDEQGTAYLVMEFIDGVNLRDLRKTQGTPDLRLTLELMQQTLQALSFLHRKNIVHRDVAPDNLMLTHDEDGNPLIKLIDLGIAKAVDDNRGLTVAGTFLGKLSYASPEQFGALEPGEALDGRSDIYSLGVVFYELLTGVRPFQAATPALLPHVHLRGDVIPFEMSDPGGKVPPAVRAIVMKALARDRKDRWASADEMAREIGRVKILVPALDEDRTIAVISIVRASVGSEANDATITPGIQERLNEEFASHATPEPAPLAEPPAIARTAPAAASRPEPPAVTRPEPPAAVKPAPAPRAASAPAARPAASPRRLGPAVAVAALAVIGIGAFLLTRRSNERAPEPGSAPVASEPTAAPAASSAAPAPRQTPVVAAAPRPSAAPPASTPAPGARPAADAPDTGLVIAVVEPHASPAAAAAPTAPAEPDAEVVKREELGIRRTIDMYLQGVSTLDAGLVERAYPAMVARVEELTKSFSEVKEQVVEIDVGLISVNGAKAQVKGKERRIVTPRTGEPSTTSRSVTIDLEKREGEWFITGLR